MNKYKILSSKTSSEQAVASLTVSGNQTAVFTGIHYLDSNGVRIEKYRDSKPRYDVAYIPATTFMVGEGQYTVYTPKNEDDETPSSRYDKKKDQTEIFVIATIDKKVEGWIDWVSYYRVKIDDRVIVVEPTTTNTDFPVSLVGNSSPESLGLLTQSVVNSTSNFAGPVEPKNPFTGMLWFDTTDKSFYVYAGSEWQAVVPFNEVKFEQDEPSKEWVVRHGFNVPEPYVVRVECYAKTDKGFKMIIPNDVTFSDSNTVTVAFTKARSGFAIVTKYKA